MTEGQRNVVVIALGLALAVAAATVNGLMASSTSSGVAGWFAYDPPTSVVLPASNGDILREAFVWGAAIAVWLAVSYRLMGRPPDA